MKMKIILFISLFFFLSSSLMAEQIAVGVVSDVENDVISVYKGVEKRLDVGMFIEKGSKIITGKMARVKIMMMDDSLLIIAPDSEFSIDEYLIDIDKKSRKSILGLLRGKVLFYVNKVFSKEGSKFEVRTKTSIAGVRGTKFIVESGDREFVGVINGEVSLKTQDKELILSEGKCAESSTNFVIADINPQILQEYNDNFKIKNSKMQVAMLERGTGISGEALLEHAYKDSIAEKSLYRTREVSDGIDKKIDRREDVDEGVDFGEKTGDRFDTSNKDGTDIVVGNNTFVKIRILLPFVKMRR